MKSKITPFLAAFIFTTSAHAATKTWDVTPGDGASITAGSGTWLTDAPNWNTGTGDSNWTTGDMANFQAVNDLGNYVITVGGPITTDQTASSLTFSNSGFTLQAASAQTITLGTATTAASISVASGKTATIGDNLTLKKGGAAGNFGLYGGGNLTLGSGTVNGGAVLQTLGTSIMEMRNGTTLDVKPGGSLLLPRSIVVGSTVAESATTRLKISGGSFVFDNTDNSACNVVIGNNLTGQTSTGIVDITSGELNNKTPAGGIRFGPVTADTGTVSTGTVNLNGGTLTTARIFTGALKNSGVINSTFNFNGGLLKVHPATTNAAQFMAGLSSAFIKSGGATIDTNGVTTNSGNVVIAQPLLDGGGGGGLTKEGLGTLTLTGANTYTGPTIINGGKLAITAPYHAITAATVNNSARLKVNSSGTTPSALGTVSLNAGSGLEFDFGTYAAANQPALTIGTLNANANYVIDLSGTNIPGSTTITLLTYTTKIGTGTPVIGNLPLGVSLSGPPVDTGSAIQITVSAGSPTSFTWSKGDGDWDTATLNWNTNAAAYAEPATVTFPTLADAVDGINTVNLTANRAPFSVSITNAGNYNTTAYAFTGSGAITGATGITKTGLGIARFSTANNSYTGPLTVSAGAVIKDVADNTTGSITVADGATFVLAGGITDGSGQTLTLSGPGWLNTGYFFANAFNQRGSLQGQSGNNTWAGNISLTGTAGIGGTTRIGVQNDNSPTLTGTSLTLTGTISEAIPGMSPYFRAGDGATDNVIIAGTCSWTGPTRIFSNGGSVAIAGNDKFPTTSDLIVGPSAATLGSPTFDLAGFNQTVAGLSGAAVNIQPTIKNSGLVRSTLTLNPTTASSFPGKIQDDVKLVIGGTAPQTLTGDNTNTADTVVNTGANLIVSSDGELQFYPAANGVTNSVGGTGTFEYDGTLRIDMSFTSRTPGNSWTLVKVGTLATTFGPTFSVTGWPGAFAETAVNSGIWKVVDSDVVWTFTEATGKLSVATYVASPFDNWIGNYFPGETNPAIIAKDADPDGDGVNNLAEFALGGIPNDGTNSGYQAMALTDTNANSQKELTLTLAVRKGGGSPVFSGSPLSAVSDGVKYTIQGSQDLTFPNSTVSEAAPATGPAGLPADYEYRRFRLNASEGLPNKGFLRVKTEAAP